MILDVFPSYKDKDTVDLLYQFERATGSSLNILVEKYLEKMLYEKGYLTMTINEEASSEDNSDTPIKDAENNMKHIHIYKNKKKFIIKKWINKVSYLFGSYEEVEDAKKVRDFLISKNWDKKYSTKETGLRGQKHVDWIFSEMEKENKQ